MVRIYWFSLVISTLTEIVYYDVSVSGSKYVLSLIRSGETSYGHSLWINFITWFDSKLVTDAGIWLGSIVGWIVGKIEWYRMWTIIGVLIGWSLRKYVGSLLGIRLVSIKVSVEGRFLGLALKDMNGAPLGRSVGWNYDVVSCKEPGSILGSRKEFPEDEMFGLAIGDVDGPPPCISVGLDDYIIVGRDLWLTVGKILALNLDLYEGLFLGVYFYFVWIVSEVEKRNLEVAEG